MTDSTVAYAQPVTARSPADAEGWARAVFERGPRLLRGFVGIGWRAGLGLRLGPSGSADHVAGWQITDRSPRRIVIEASSYLMRARNRVDLDDTTVTWTTEVDYRRAIARPIWLLALPIHRISIRYLLQRAAQTPTA